MPKAKDCMSPSVWREWIEIDWAAAGYVSRASLPPCGGSGLKSYSFDRYDGNAGLPPCGGSGLKSPDCVLGGYCGTSPSVWREWIKMCYNNNKGGGDEVSLRVEGVD